jgi:hypothetical protein
MKTSIRTKYNLKFIAVACFTTIMLNSCKTNKEIPMPKTPEVLTPVAVQPQAFEFKTICRNFSANVDGIGISLNGQLRIEDGKNIWITLNKLVEIARLKLTSDSIHVIIKMQNKYYQGSYADFAKSIGININYECIQSLLLGNDIASYPFKDVQHRVAEGIAQYTFDARTAPNLPTIQQTMYVDMVTNKIIENNINTPQGELLQIKYSQFKDTERQKLPTQIKISFKDKANKINASITFGKTTVNQELSFPFKIPYAAKPLQL